MKKAGLQYIMMMVLSLMLLSCTRNFEALNTDPNRPKNVYPGAILNQMQYRTITENMYTGAWKFTHELMQVHAPGVSTGGGGLHRYEVSKGTTGWQSYFDFLTDVEDIYHIADRLGEDNYRAIALVYKSWIFQILTDLYGDIPYSEALQAGEGNFKPAFDRQKDIYKSLLENLETANGLFDKTKALTYSGDMVYNANTLSNGENAGIIKWKKFCNSLRLRMLLRILARDGEIDVRHQIETMLATPAQYPLFENNSEEAIFRFTGVQPYFNAFHNARQLDWSETYYFTQFFTDRMKADNDPRKAIWMTQVPVGDQLVYQGIESGYPVSHPVYLAGQNSTYPAALKTSAFLGVMMTYAEVEFIKAELSLKGFQTGGSPRQHYEAGIRASMKQWGVTMPDNYLEQPGVVYQDNATVEEQLQQIILQKYYAFFFNDYQSWFEKRRTGYPILPRGTGIPAENQFPNRASYPTYLQSLNPANLADAVAAMGGDGTNIKVWWQK